MFNLDNIELDFDEDFSSNIFSKRVNSGARNAREGEKIWSKGRIMESLNENTEDESSLSCILNSPLAVGTVEKKLKRPSVQDEKPQKKRVSCEGLVQRKFPGPAGLLPEKSLKEVAEIPLVVERLLAEEEENLVREKPVIYSQCSGSVFQEAGYQKLVTEFNLKDLKNPLNKYTVEWVKKKALSKGLQGRKIPFLGVVVHAVNHSLPDPVLELRDPTGEISGSLHREVWTEMGGKVRSGISLALRQVGVLITGVIRRQIYLNITMNNILAIYSPSESEKKVEVTTVNRVPKSDLCKSFVEQALHPLPPSSPFTTTESPHSLASKEQLGSSQEVHKCRVKAKGGEGQVDAFADWEIVLSESDFSEEIQVPLKASEPETSCSTSPVKTSTQALSPAESLIFEEVLSGINLDEFDM